MSFHYIGLTANLKNEAPPRLTFSCSTLVSFCCLVANRHGSMRRSHPCLYVPLPCFLWALHFIGLVGAPVAVPSSCQLFACGPSPFHQFSLPVVMSLSVRCPHPSTPPTARRSAFRLFLPYLPPPPRFHLTVRSVFETQCECGTCHHWGPLLDMYHYSLEAQMMEKKVHPLSYRYCSVFHIHHPSITGLNTLDHHRL